MALLPPITTTPSPHLILLSVIIFLPLITIPTSSKKPYTSFDFPSFSSQENLIVLLDDAHIHNGTLFLAIKNPITPLSMSSGVALFHNPVPFQGPKTNSPPFFYAKFVFTVNIYIPLLCRNDSNLTFFLSSSIINTTSLNPSLPNIEDSSIILFTLEFNTEYDDPRPNHIRIHVWGCQIFEVSRSWPPGIDFESRLQYRVLTEYNHEKKRLEVWVCSYFSVAPGSASNCRTPIIAASINISNYSDHKHMYTGFSTSTDERCPETLHAIKKWGFRMEFQAEPNTHSRFSIFDIIVIFCSCSSSPVTAATSLVCSLIFSLIGIHNIN